MPSNHSSLSAFGVLVSCALPAELRCLIDFYRAKKYSGSSPWPIYLACEGQIVLLETGMGITASAAALSYTVAKLGLSRYWSAINYGIAGAGHLPIGQWLATNVVHNTVNQQTYYLTPPRRAAWTTGAVHTVSMPSTDYGCAVSYDMEAAGFVDAMKRFLPLEQLGVMKIISDTNRGEQQAVSPQMVKDLLAKHSDGLVQFIDYYLAHSQSQVEQLHLPDVPTDLWSAIHFSQTQRNRMQRLWRSYRIFGSESLFNAQIMQVKTAADMLCWVEKQLAQVNHHWEGV